MRLVNREYNTPGSIFRSWEKATSHVGRGLAILDALDLLDRHVHLGLGVSSWLPKLAAACHSDVSAPKLRDHVFARVSAGAQLAAQKAPDFENSLNALKLTELALTLANDHQGYRDGAVRTLNGVTELLRVRSGLSVSSWERIEAWNSELADRYPWIHPPSQVEADCFVA